MYVHSPKHKRALVDFASSTVLLVYLEITLLWSHMGVSSSHCQMRGWWQWREEKESTNDGHMASSRTPLLLWLVSIPWSVVPWLRAAFFRPQPHAPPVQNNTRSLNFFLSFKFFLCLEHRERSFTFRTLCSKKKYYEKKRLKFKIDFHKSKGNQIIDGDAGLTRAKIQFQSISSNIFRSKKRFVIWRGRFCA